MKERLHKITNGIATGMIWLFSMITVLPLILVVGYIVVKGVRHISLNLIMNNPAPVGEAGGGVLNGIAGSGIILLIAACIGIPVGLLGGVFLVEARDGKFKRAARLSVEILQGIPSIVIGIIAYIILVVPMQGFSAYAGGVALAILMLPIIVISTEEVLRLVPVEIREAGIALGMPRWRVTIFVVLRTGLGGVISGILLSLSRVAGETAPLLFTTLGSAFFNLNPTKPTAALPLQIFNYSISPYEEWHSLGFAASFLLLVVILGINIITKTVIEKMN